ncbi:MAG: hypothetical protein KAY65_08970 [Planctomycetes bacterium]|nr:hypothetical protein [Planctomycetota bacterium]
MRLYQSTVLVLAVLGVCVGAASASDGQEGLNSILNESPYTYLLDTGAPSPGALSERELARKTGWTIVPEDNLRHKFRGDTVFLNDKITVVLRRSGSGAEVYSQTADGLKQRAQLFACADGADRTAGLSSVRIIENNPAAVMLELVFQTQQHKNVSATYRLTTGQIYLEIAPGDGMNRLFIRSNARHTVVPDYFGDDVVFSPGSFKGSRIGVPAENFLLHMLEGNDGIVMCVWESDEAAAQLISSSESQGRVISGCDIQCIKGERIWVAFMEGSNIWHEQLISDQDRDRDIILDWEPPFRCQWRADFIKNDELAQSCNFRDKPEPESVWAAADEQACFCWFDRDRPCVRMPKLRTMEMSESNTAGRAWPVIVYPIDRSRATPLRVFCPTDIMRNTLGVGPCEYILEKEGFGSEPHSTPDQVTRWVENLFKKKKEKQASAQIEERLEQMLEHIRLAQTRISQYGDFARRARKLTDKAKSNKAVADALGRLLEMVDQMEQNIVIKSNSAKLPESAARLTDEIIALVGKDGAQADCLKLGSQIRAVGAAQDKALSKCRMAVRRIKQQCLMIAAREPQAGDFAGKVRELAEQMLQEK